MTNPTTTQPKPVYAEFRPNYDIPCENCGECPTVDVYVEDNLQTNMELCGACCWGEAECIDPEHW